MPPRPPPPPPRPPPFRRLASSTAEAASTHSAAEAATLHAPHHVGLTAVPALAVHHHGSCIGVAAEIRLISSAAPATAARATSASATAPAAAPLAATATALSTSEATLTAAECHLAAVHLLELSPQLLRVALELNGLRVSASTRLHEHHRWNSTRHPLAGDLHGHECQLLQAAPLPATPLAAATPALAERIDGRQGQHEAEKGRVGRPFEGSKITHGDSPVRVTWGFYLKGVPGVLPISRIYHSPFIGSTGRGDRAGISCSD